MARPRRIAEFFHSEPENQDDWVASDECKGPEELFPKSKFVLVSPVTEVEISGLLQTMAQTLLSEWQSRAPMQVLSNDVAMLKREVAELRKSAHISLTIQSLVPEAFEIIAPIPVVVRSFDESYVATFFDANVNASGDTDVESVQNLKDMLVASYELLFSHDDDDLGAEMLRRKQVLAKFMRPVSE